MIEGKEADDITPKYNNYKGEISKANLNMISSGVIENQAEGVYRITELPIMKSTEEYKQYLIEEMERG